VIRFRFQEDERRFIRLHAELFEKLARAGLSEVVGSETLRNVSKIEQMAHMEGIRQGLAMAAIARQMNEEEALPIPDPYGQKAFQLHALIYGSSDTPLRAIEKEWLDKLGLDPEHFAKSWLDDKPMRYAPATLQELDGTVPPIAPMMSIRAPHKPMPVKPSAPGMTDLMVTPEDIDDYLPPSEAMHGAEVTVPEPWQKGEYEPDDPEPFDTGVASGYRPQSQAGTQCHDVEEIRPESPEFLDIVRDAIQTKKSAGWDPKTWQDIILDLHRHMGVDAGFLDIQLTTHVGRTVLDQCGLVGMAPPDMMSFEFLSNLPGKSGGMLEEDRRTLERIDEGVTSHDLSSITELGEGEDFELLANISPPLAGKVPSPPLMVRNEDGELHSSLGEPGEGTMGFGKAHDWDDEI